MRGPSSRSSAGGSLPPRARCRSAWAPRGGESGWQVQPPRLRGPGPMFTVEPVGAQALVPAPRLLSLLPCRPPRAMPVLQPPGGGHHRKEVLPSSCSLPPRSIHLFFQLPMHTPLRPAFPVPPSAHVPLVPLPLRRSDQLSMYPSVLLSFCPRRLCAVRASLMAHPPVRLPVHPPSCLSILAAATPHSLLLCSGQATRTQHSTVVEGTGSRTGLSGFGSQHCRFLAVCPWPGFLASLCLSPLLC